MVPSGASEVIAYIWRRWFHDQRRSVVGTFQSSHEFRECLQAAVADPSYYSRSIAAAQRACVSPKIPVYEELIERRNRFTAPTEGRVTSARNLLRSNHYDVEPHTAKHYHSQITWTGVREFHPPLHRLTPPHNVPKIVGFIVTPARLLFRCLSALFNFSKSVYIQCVARPWTCSVHKTVTFRVSEVTTVTMKVSESSVNFRFTALYQHSYLLTYAPTYIRIRSLTHSLTVFLSFIRSYLLIEIQPRAEQKLKENDQPCVETW